MVYLIINFCFSTKTKHVSDRDIKVLILYFIIIIYIFKKKLQQLK